MQYGFSQQSFVVFTCTQKQILKYNMVPNTECTSLLSENRIMGAFFLVVITLNYLTHNYQVKHWLISMPQMFPWSRIEYNKFLSQNLWYAILQVLHQCFFELIQNIYKACNDIHEVNLSHMHSVLLAPALFQHSHKKLTVNHVLPALFKSKRVLSWNYPRSISSAKHFALHL